MKPIKSLMPILLVGLLPQISAAVPAKYSNCPSIKVSEPKNSSGFFMSEDCTQVYVLPPRLGRLSVTGYNLSILPEKVCKIIEKKENTNLQYAELIELNSLQMVANAKTMETIQGQINSGLLPMGTSEETLREKISQLRKENREISEDSDYYSEKSVAELSEYSQREGSWGNFIMESTYSELLEAFRKKNEDLAVSFSRLPIDQSYLAIIETDKTGEQNKIEMSAVLTLDSAQLGTAMPLLKTIGETLTTQQISEAEAKKNLRIFSDALSGQIRFSAIGACALEDSGGKLDSFSMDDVKGYVSSNVFYQYQVQVKRHHKITYNLAELFRRIQEQKKKGGMFSRKTMNKLIETRESDSWIQFHVESNDVQFEYTDEYIKEVKAEFISRALAQVIAAKTGNPVAALTLVDPSGKNGAEAISDALSKCPHLYCQIGAAGFTVLNSIFGSTTAVAELVQKFDANITEEVLEKKMVEQVGSMTFL